MYSVITEPEAGAALSQSRWHQQQVYNTGREFFWTRLAPKVAIMTLDLTNTEAFKVSEDHVRSIYFTHGKLKYSVTVGGFTEPPPYWVENEPDATMKKVVHVAPSTETGTMYVYCGRSTIGKSVAACAILRMVLDELWENKIKNYPYLFIKVGDDLKSSIRTRVGVP